uniref:Uncharacterized protein n=1 Tax=Tetranychus urticae TaxID=32264 RepID=T1KGC1_TETUR
MLKQMAAVDEELSEEKKKETESKAEQFHQYHRTIVEKINQLTSQKERIDEHLALTTRLRDVLKRQLKETVKRRDQLKENWTIHCNEIEKLSKQLKKETKKYQKDLLTLEETFKNARLDDQTLIENYKMKEKLIAKELEERMVIRKSLEQAKLADEKEKENEEKEEEEDEEDEEEEVNEEEGEKVEESEKGEEGEKVEEDGTNDE